VLLDELLEDVEPVDEELLDELAADVLEAELVAEELAEDVTEAPLDPVTMPLLEEAPPLLDADEVLATAEDDEVVGVPPELLAPGFPEELLDDPRPALKHPVEARARANNDRGKRMTFPDGRQTWTGLRQWRTCSGAAERRERFPPISAGNVARGREASQALVQTAASACGEDEPALE
jgi:hypothetical protein